jgi:hypothetical protein
LSVESQIVTKFLANNRGQILFPENFSAFGSEEAVRIALHRLVRKQILVRLAHGIYIYPKEDKTLGVLYPSFDEIAKAIAKRDKARFISTGVHALNELGLSTQIPMKVVYLTDGSPRSIQVGKRSIVFKKTSPKNLAAIGEISRLVIQALREIGKDKISGDQLKKIRKLLRIEKLDIVKHDAALASVWIKKIMIDAINNHSQ